jgi:Zn-dependent protease
MADSFAGGCPAMVRNANFHTRINHFSQSQLDKSIQQFILIAPVLLFSMVAHEYAHGYAAMKQGDNTAFMLGRLTWNPIPHIDLFMTILLPLLTYFGSGGQLAFGGAKPVPVIPRNYRNYKRGDIIVSLAGVATNVVLALCCIPLIMLTGFIARLSPLLSDTGAIIQTMLLFGVWINLALAAFNLIPIPPLDGSHVFKYLLPPAWALNYQRLGSQGLIILIVLLTFGRPLINLWFAPVIFLDAMASRAVMPFIIPSPWTM